MFAAAALLLSAVGIYGVMAYNVTQSTREIGIRVALGAKRSAVFTLFLHDALSMALAGMVIGLLVALGITWLMKTMLFGVSASDPLTFAEVAALLMIVALAACYIPARRAMRVDPVVALRHE